MPIVVLDVWLIILRLKLVFRYKEILNSDVTLMARCIQDEVTFAHLSHSTFLEDRVFTDNMDHTLLLPCGKLEGIDSALKLLS